SRRPSRGSTIRVAARRPPSRCVRASAPRARGAARSRSVGAAGWVALPSRDDHRERLPAAHGRGRRETGAVEIDVPLREPAKHLVESDSTLESGERGTEAEMDAVAERQMLSDVAVDVEAVGIRVAAF